MSEGEPVVSDVGPASNSGMARPTVASLVQTTSQGLAAAGIGEPMREARRLVAGVADLPSEALITRPDQAVGADVSDRVAAALARRCRHEPLSRILGWREFYGRRFSISPAVLDPRPDTETLVDLALELAGPTPAPKILDLGTGSGCVLLTLLCELQAASGTGIDLSAAACAVADANANELGLASRTQIVCGDALDVSLGPHDLLVSNPPYIATEDVSRLAPDVRDFDPELALDGGADGMSFYRRLGPRIPSLVPDGWTIVEVGAGMAERVLALLLEGARTAGATVVDSRVKRDLLGHERCVAIRTLTGNRC